MKTDTSYFNLENACWTIIDDKTIISYTDGLQGPDGEHAHTYKLIGNTWRQSETDLTATKPENAQCYTLEEIKDIDSPLSFLDPFIHTLAIGSALLLFYAAYKLILHPFWRKP